MAFLFSRRPRLSQLSVAPADYPKRAYDSDVMPMMLLALLPSPPAWLVLPFCLLLLALACCPLLTPKFWEHHFRKTVIGLGVVPVLYYLVVFRAVDDYLGVALDYASFMIVIGSLFVISAGIFLGVKGEATPAVNSLYLLVGALLGSVIGTTGASMLLIRPWIQMNRYRFTGMHVAFFIFFVSNIGGALTPVGPPLFMGYLKGVPFWWSLMRCWPAWTVTTAMVLGVFYVLDRRNFLRAPRQVREEKTAHEAWRFDGLHNLLLMALVLGAIIFMPGGIREITMLAAAALSYVTTNKNIHEHNHFNFGPIKEVGWIFLGIFAAMKPVLDYMVIHAGELGLHHDAQFYWFSGLLSGVLDNAPTYLTFFAAAFGLEHLNLDNLEHMKTFIAHHDHYLIAISLGSSCFGALTYIGNGPNLMVKAICDHGHVHTPHFFSYIYKYSLPVLIPVFAIVSWLFFR
jgi:Na+/H+ antiporter NhaD/arsenite permease-like protein